jgi:subfamily B ATP-binding cassette protein MsbA
MRRVARQTQEEMGGMNTLLMQAFQGIRIIKSFRLEESETSRVKTVAYKLRDLSIGATRLEAAAQPIIDVFGGVAITAVIIYGGSRVIDGATTPGAFFSFIAAIMMAYQPLRSLSKMNVTIQQGLAAAARVFALIDRQPALLEAPDAKDVERVSGDVVFNNVSFSYNDEDFALNGVSFTAPAGGITALVGPSGAGKSTVFSLIPRFYDPQSGDVFINGVNVKHATLGSLRDAISIVSQEATLFNDTIANNIRCGNPDADDAAVERAARMAAAHEFIVEQPDGYDTMIGEHGMRLSGGQRQRIAIARAILKDAPILLLDEATSALDTESERLIQQALSQLMQGRTTIVIAHRLSTIRDADVIHAFDKGKVVETGDHTSLLAQNGLYARLHALQFHEGA